MEGTERERVVYNGERVGKKVYVRERGEGREREGKRDSGGGRRDREGGG